jgi:leucyl aminopeptidase (aminopeptidase T)
MLGASVVFAVTAFSISHTRARRAATGTCHVVGPAGTDVRLSLRGRRAVCDNGNLAEPGAFGNLPAGEAYIAPVETSGDGVIVFDGALAGYGVLTEPLSVTLRDGRAVSASGPAASWLLEKLDAGGKSGRQISELGWRAAAHLDLRWNTSSTAPEGPSKASFVGSALSRGSSR